jgi:hypothetical protein
METIKKYNIKLLKEDIKKLAELQRFYKIQRKFHLGHGVKRELEEWEAQSKHSINRIKLRITYAAYGLMRGKKFSVIENNHSEEGHPLYKLYPSIKKIMNDYLIKEEIEHVEEENYISK